MKRLLLALFLAPLPLHAATSYTITVLFDSKAVQPATQAALITAIESGFDLTKVKTAYGSDTYTLTIKGKKPAPPPPPSTTLDSGTAVDACAANFFGNGLEEERKQTMLDIAAVKARANAANACGAPMVGTPASIDAAFLAGCKTGYDVMESTVGARQYLVP